MTTIPNPFDVIRGAGCVKQCKDAGGSTAGCLFQCGLDFIVPGDTGPGNGGECPPGTSPDFAGNCAVAIGGTGPCDDPSLVRGPDGRCVFPRSPRGREAFGEAQMGRFGAGIVPGVVQSVTRRCPKGTVLGLGIRPGEELCYDRTAITNKQRLWPRGRKPLLTGGEMRAISIASSAAKRVQAKRKQLESLGMLPKAHRRALPRPRTVIQESGAGGVVVT